MTSATATPTRSDLTTRLAGLVERLAHHQRRLDSARSNGKRADAQSEVSRYTELVSDARAELAALPAEPVSAPSVSAPTARRNQYAGTCECGRSVPAGRGYLENDGGWRVFCGACGLSSTVG